MSAFSKLSRLKKGRNPKAEIRNPNQRALAFLSAFGFWPSFCLRGFGFRISARPGLWQRFLAGFTFLLLSANPLLACSACYGVSDAPMARGMNWGILSLLAVVGVVLGGVASFFVFIGVRSAQKPAMPPPTDLPESTTKG